MISGNCEKCGHFRRSLDEDHIVPKWKGGTDDPSNLQYLCKNCHQDKTMDEGDLLGRKHTPETIARIADQKRGVPLSAETRQRMRDSAQGPSEETKAKISTAIKTPEVRAKISAGSKAAWARRKAS